MNNFTHVIIFHDKSKKFISQQAHDMIWKLSTSGKQYLKFGDSLISFSAISKIITKSEFYEQYPKERHSLFEYKSFNGLGLRGVIDSTKAANGLKDMIKGMKKYIESTEQNPVCPNGKQKSFYRGTSTPIEILELMENKLKLIENEH